MGITIVITRGFKTPIPLVIFKIRSYLTSNIPTPPQTHHSSTSDVTQDPTIPLSDEVLLLMDAENTHLRKQDDMVKITAGIEKTLENGGFPTRKVEFRVYGNSEDPHRVPYLPCIIEAGFTHIETPGNILGFSCIEMVKNSTLHLTLFLHNTFF